MKEGKDLHASFQLCKVSHTGSGSACESSLKPVTRLPEYSFLMPAKWWWQRRQCQRSQFKERVVADEREANSSTGMVSPTRKAEFEAPVFAWKAILLSLLNFPPLKFVLVWGHSSSKDNAFRVQNLGFASRLLLRARNKPPETIELKPGLHIISP